MNYLMPMFRVLAIACVVGSVAGACASASGEAAGVALVEHATVTNLGFAVELWADPASDVIAVRRVGETTVIIVRGLVADHVDDGHVSERASYRSVSSAWFGVHLRYGVTLDSALAALAAGDEVERPALMTPPALSWQSNTYTRVWDFDTDLSALRRAVSFPVPRLPVRVAGLQLADVARLRTRGPGDADTGLSAMIEYSSDPARRGTNDRELTLNGAAVSGGMGAVNAGVFKNSHDPLVGRGYDARLVNDNQAILRYRGTYIALTATRTPTRSAWRAILVQITK